MWKGIEFLHVDMDIAEDRTDMNVEMSLLHTE